MNAFNGPSSSGSVNTSTGEQDLDLSVWSRMGFPTLDWVTPPSRSSSSTLTSSTTVPSAAVAMSTVPSRAPSTGPKMRFQPESPLNDTAHSGLLNWPYGITYQDALSTGGESLVGGNVEGPQARIELQMLRPEPPDENPIDVRRENQIVIGIFIIQEPDPTGSLWTYIKLFGAATEENPGIPLGQDELTLALEVHGATTGTPFMSACQRCSTKVPAAPLNSSLFDFAAAKSGRVAITDGLARVAFRFRCLPFHHGNTDREYQLTATIWDGKQILTRRTFPNHLRIVHHLRRRKGIPIAVLPGDAIVVDTSVDSEQSRDAPPNARISDGSFSGTSAGESQRSIPTQPSYPTGQSPSARPFAPTPRTNEESEPEREGGGLPAFTARGDKCVLTHMNPRRGSTNGGDEVYLIVRNLPPTMELYARFGPNITPTIRIMDGVLSCVLPRAERPEVVHVTLCQKPSEHEDGYGKSLVSFEYQCDTSKALLASWLNAKHGGYGVGTGVTSL